MIRGVILVVGGPGPMLKKFPKLAKLAMQGGLDYWHSKLLPRHFTAGAGNRYRYTPRQEKYQRRKQRAKGHGRPLVWSGRMQRELTGQVRLSGTGKKATATMRAPKYLYYIKARMLETRKVDKVKELTTVVNKEERDMLKRVDRKLQTGINAVKDREVIRI